MEPDRAARWVLALALLFALVRLVRLAEWSLWIDEALTVADRFHGLEGGEIKNALGYHVIRWTVDLLGGTPDELALRIGPAIAGILCVPATWAAFRGLFGPLPAAGAALLVSTSAWHVYWSQNARFYTFAQLVSLAGTALVARGLLRGRPILAASGLVVAAAAALLHPSAVLLLPVLAFGPWILARARRPLGPATSRAPLVLAWIGIVGGVVALKWAYDAWSIYAYQKEVGSTPGEILASMAHFAKTIGFHATPLLFAAAACGAFVALRRRAASDLFALAVVASVFLFALVAATSARVSAQYVFCFLPWIAILACLPLARALGDGGSLGPRGSLGWMALLVIPAVVTNALYFTVRQGERPPWRDAYQFVWDHKQEGDLVFGMDASVGEYYLAPWNDDLRNSTVVGWLDYYHAREALRWAHEGRRGWYLVNPEQFLGWKPEDADDFKRFLREECRLVRAWPLYVESRDLSIWVYVRD